MISSDQIETKQICVKTLINLMADSSLYKPMVEDGAIWGFSSLAQLGDPVLVELCAKAICSLSCEFAEEMLLSTATLKTIIMLINRADDVELQRAGGRALLNLLVCTTHTHEHLHQYVVQNLSTLANCHDEEISELVILSLCIISMSESCRERIVNSGMLKMIDASTIFASAPLSYAYLTMFGNIANNPTMRTKVLDDRSINRFEQIVKAGDYELDLAVIKAIYCISCANSNIPKLADQNLLPVVCTIHRAKYEKTPELILYIIVTLYNMTTVESVQATLVIQGYVGVLVSLWPEAKRDPKLAIHVMMAILHLSNGHINTTRLVDEGATSILIFLAEKKHPQGFNIPYNMYHRCAAGFRNLLCATSNQVKMVKFGVIDAIINLAQRAETPRNIQDPLTPHIKENCAAALRSMTYNESIRETIKNSAAIDIMLEEDDKLQYSLLVELEAESWTNGARGATRQGRSKPISAAPLVTDFLKPTVDVKLQIDKRYAELNKFHVQVQLDEPNLELEAHVEGLAIGINDLASYEDAEEASAPLMQSCPKQEVELSPIPIHLLKASEDVEGMIVGSGAGVLPEESYPEFNGGQPFERQIRQGSFDAAPTTNSRGGPVFGALTGLTPPNRDTNGAGLSGSREFDPSTLPLLKPASGGGGTPFVPPTSAPSERGGSGPGNNNNNGAVVVMQLSKSLGTGDFPVIGSSAAAAAAGRKDSSAQMSVSASHGQLPPVTSSNATTAAGTPAGAPGAGSPDDPSSSKKRPKVKKPVDPEKTFGTLVAMIKGGAPIGDVVDRWVNISRF